VPWRRRQRHTPPAPPPTRDVRGEIRAQRPTPASSRPRWNVAVDRAAAELATLQDGVAARDQLITLGVSEHAIDHRVRTGRFIPVFRGVYAVGHAALSDVGRMRAALIAAGAGATLSLRSAAALHLLIPRCRRPSRSR
jgi:hypothetical protein